MIKRLFQSVFGHQSTPDIILATVDQEDIELLQLQLASKEQEIERLKEQIVYHQQNPVVHVVEKEVHVDHFTFTPESYRKFKRKLESPVCTATTTPTQAAYFLGISRVLSVLEDEHVTSR